MVTGVELSLTMRTWELNVAELLQLLHQTNLKILKEPTPDDLKGVAICMQNAKKSPTELSDLGRIQFCAKSATKMKLKGKDGGKHEDGEDGEVYVQTFTNRKKIKQANLIRNMILFCNYITLFVHYCTITLAD